MNQENLEFLKKSFEYRGFGEVFNAGLEKNMKAGREAFQLAATFDVNGDTMHCEAHLRKHSEHDHYYFNHYVATLAVKEGQEISAKIKTKWKVSLSEARRLLKYGDKVAVYKSGIKTDEGEKFGAYINFSTDQTDENGYCRLNMYHDNYYQKYPFIVEESIGRVRVPIKFEKDLEEIKQDLMQAIPVPVMMELDGRQQEGYLTINAAIGRVEVVDKELESVEFFKKQNQDQTVSRTEVKAAQQSESPAPEVKKKPWHEQSNNRRERIRHRGPSL